jgi:hypothetical protein
MKDETREQIEYELEIARNHEAIGLRHLHDILREEEDELWNEIKKKPFQRDKQRIRQEAAQVAANAIRIMEEGL